MIFLYPCLAKQVKEKPDYPAIFVSDGEIMLTLWQAATPNEANAFDRKNHIGLHHLALRIENSTVLEQFYERLVETDGVEIEFSPELPGDDSTKHMMCNIPGGLRIKFIAAE